ncbi:hypothetical protein ELQ90_12160 [Labedella phragmitis]|uniref:DUF1257 domain-containing protein n=1 Tax=Labedella phragmitis TaxID=2498849 RepID=A0A3S4AIU0_9MICO|nr:hypothetical protein [Labedella phragmitis]RWZ49519.1 hypothetical protein ELQ90_12160 [Labedella phragmitis]
MSVTILLIPAALAAASLAGGTGLTAALAARREGRQGGSPTDDSVGTAVSVSTRMKDSGLLDAALADIGAVDVVVGESDVTATVDGHVLAMTLTDEDVWEAHFSRDGGVDADASIAEDVIARLDAAYARRVQAAVADRIRARADSAGFELVSESRDEDATVTMVLNVRQGG